MSPGSAGGAGGKSSSGWSEPGRAPVPIIHSERHTVLGVAITETSEKRIAFPTTTTTTTTTTTSSFARLIIADDHELVRSSLRLMLQGEQDLQIIAEARDGQEAIELYRRHRPTLVLMDVNMPEVNGFEATRTIKEEFPTAKVLIVSAYESAALTSEAIVAGADGYVSKLYPLQELLEAIRAVLRGESIYPLKL